MINLFSILNKILLVIGNPWESIYKRGIPSDLIFPYAYFFKVINLLKRSHTTVVLDLAMGHGRHVVELIDNGFDVYGFDLSKNALRLAKKNVQMKFPEYDVSKFISGNMYKKIPFENKKFDSVVAIQAIYHGFRENMQKSIDETARVLKSGGSFIYTISNDKTRSTTTLESIKKRKNLIIKVGNMTYLPLTGREKGLVHFYPNEEIIKEMLVKDFNHVIIRQDFDNDYFLVSCQKR